MKIYINSIIRLWIVYYLPQFCSMFHDKSVDTLVKWSWPWPLLTSKPCMCSFPNGRCVLSTATLSAGVCYLQHHCWLMCAIYSAIVGRCVLSTAPLPVGVAIYSTIVGRCVLSTAPLSADVRYPQHHCRPMCAIFSTIGGWCVLSTAPLLAGVCYLQHHCRPVCAIYSTIVGRCVLSTAPCRLVCAIYGIIVGRCVLSTAPLSADVCYLQHHCQSVCADCHRLSRAPCDLYQSLVICI